MKTLMPMNPRLLAIEAVGEVLDERISLAECPSLKNEAPGRDLSMARHLAYGMLRWLTALEWLSGQLLKKLPKQRDRDIHRLIMLGIYQLWQDGTPGHAAVHETAECARRLEKPWAVGLINAVLRRFQREQGDWITRLEEQDARFGHPAWLLETVRQVWPEDWESIVAANNEPPPFWLRFNQRAINADDMVESLEDQGFEVSRHPYAPEAVRIEPAAPVHSLKGFGEGWLAVQDPAAQLAPEVLQAENGMKILDACAAPGGKTCHLLERYPQARLTAVELHSARTERIRENLRRLHLDCQVVVGDATRPKDWWDGTPFDRILLDAPCSASGVIRRHPDIRHLRIPEQVAEAVSLQSAMLDALWPLLKPGGMLVYATCSIFSEENSERVSAFLDSHPDASEKLIKAGWGRPAAHGRQILPGEDEMDGFFYAVLRKST